MARGTGSGQRGRRTGRRSLVSALALAALLAVMIAVPVVPTRAAAPAGVRPASAINTPSQSQQIPAGSYIIDMGVTPQTVANGLLPYGLVYALMIEHMIPVEWVIDDSKASDGVDFTYNGKEYRGGTFIVRAEYADQAAATIAAWRARGVVVDGPTTSAFQAPVYKTMTNWPNAVLDAQNGKIAQAYYTLAGIPQTVTNAATGGAKVAYEFLNPLDPSFVNGCFDLYVMPHADPTYATHHTLRDFNEFGGYIWAGCHAVSVLEGIRAPNGDLALNFLSTNGLIHFRTPGHADPVAPFSRTTNGGDPVNQYIGLASTAQLNGSERVYLPSATSGWRPDTNLIEWSPNQADVTAGRSPGPAAMSIYGRGLGNPANGMVMYQSGHDLSGSGAASVSAIRQFLNFNLQAGIERGIDVTVDAPETIVGSRTQQVSATISGGHPDYSYEWVSSCGGSFDTPTGSVPGDDAPVTLTANFTAPAQAQGCAIKLSVVDHCGRTSFGTDAIDIVEVADLSITKTDRTEGLIAGSDDTYTVVVTNHGPGTANPVTVSEEWPRDLITFVSATPTQGTCAFGGIRVDCDIGPIPPDGTVTILLRGTVLPNAHGTITNTVRVSAPQEDPNPDDNEATDTTNVAPNGLHLEKSADPSSIDVLSAGGGVPVTFTFAVTNTGPNDLSDVQISDSDVPGCDPSLRSGDTNGDGHLQPGERWIFTCTVSLADDTENTATASATDPEIGTVTATDTATVEAIAPSISITKGVDGNVNSSGGDVVFHITVTNTGDTPLTDVTVTDDDATGCNRSLGTMQPGDVITYACSISPAPEPGSSGTNLAAVVGTAPGGSEVTDEDPAPWSVTARDLAITKTPVDCETHDPVDQPAFYPGDRVCYRIRATNTGQEPHTDVTLTDQLPPGLSHVRTSWETSVARIQQEVFNEDFDANATQAGNTWAHGVVEVNEANDRTAGHVRAGNVNTTDDNATAVCNATHLAADPEHGCVVFAEGQRGIAVPLPSNISSFHQCTFSFEYRVINVSANMGIEIGAPTGPGTNYTAGWTTFDTVAEAGVTGWTQHSTTLTGGQLAGKVVLGIRGRAAAPANNDDDRFLADNFVLTCENDYSASGETTDHPTIVGPADAVTLHPEQTLTAYVEATMTDAGGAFPRQLVDVAGVRSAEQADPSEATATVDRIRPGIGLTKEASQTDVAPGTTVTYTFTVTNTGNDPLADVAVTDDDVPGCDPQLQSGDTNGDDRLDVSETWVYTCQATIDQDVHNVASVSGTATTHSSDPEDTTLPTVTDEASADVNVVTSGIHVEKTVNRRIVRPGDSVVYTYAVTLADGFTEPLTGIFVTDDHCASIQGPVKTGGNADQSLEAGETWTFTCTSTLTETTTNTATAHGTDRVGTNVSDTDDQRVRVIDPAIAITKTADHTEATPGEDVVFTMVVTNPGDDPISGVALSDSQCSPVTLVGGDDGDEILQPGEEWTFQCTKAVEVDQTNTATVTGSDSLGGAVRASDSATVDVAAPSIDLVKFADKSLVRAGDTVTYTIVAINNGDLPLSDVVVSDDTCSPLEGPFTESVDGPDATGDLPAGDRWFYRCSTQIEATTHNTATFTATAETHDGPVEVDDTADALVRTNNPVLQVTKAARQDKVDPGAAVTYDLTVTNATDCAEDDVTCVLDNEIPNVDLDDDHCDDITPVLEDGFNVGDIGGTASGAGGDGAQNDVLDVGETWHYTCTTAVDSPTTNTVTAEGHDPLGRAVGPVEASDFVDVAVHPTLSIVKSGPDSAPVGDTVTYTYELTNTTDCDAHPDPDWCRGASYVANPAIADDVTGTPTYLSGDADENGRVDVGETWHFEATHTVTEADLVAGGVDNTVTASGTDRDGGTVGPVTDDHHLDVTSDPALSLDKQAGEPSGDVAGSTIVYTYLLTNTGNVTLTDIVVDDPDVPGITCVLTTLAPQQQTTCTGTYTITQADVDAGSVTDTATATGTPPVGSDVTSPPDDTVTSITPGPGLSIAKQAGEPSGDTAGDTIAYTFTVTNTGNVTLSDIEVRDSKIGSPDDVSCEETTLAPGASTTCSATYEITQADVDAGMVDNLATAAGTTPQDAEVESSPASTHTPLTQQPSLTIDKSAEGPTVPTAGGSITYTFVVENTGNVTLTAVAVNDDRVGTVTCEETELAPGETTTCTASYDITQTDVDSGSVANEATASGEPPTGPPTVSDPDDTVVSVAAEPAIELVKTAGEPSGHEAGDTIAYTFRVTNTGNVTLSGIVVHDEKVGEVSCPDTTLAPEESTDCTATYTITQTDVDAGVVANTATARGDPPGEDTPPVESPESATETPITPAPALTIEKSASGPSADAAGGTIAYTFRVTNTGNVTLTGIVVTDPTVGAVACPQTTLSPGNWTDCTATYTITQADVDAGSVENSATATGTPPTGEPVTSDPDETATPIDPAPSLTIQKSAGTPSGQTAGSTIEFTFVVHNTGNVTLTSVVVDDPKVGEVTCPETTLAPDQSMTCTATYTLTQADVDDGTVENEATATGSPPTGEPVTSDPDDTRTPIEPGPAIALEKAAGRPSGHAAGETIVYTYTVTNVGNVTLTDIVVNDAKIGSTDDVTCEQTTLAPGASTTCTATYTITQADVDAGTVENTATVTGQPPHGDEVTSPEDSTTTTLEQDPALTIDKQAGPPSGHTAGSTITFTYVVTNTGNVTLTGITVDDPKVEQVTCQATELAPGASTTCTATYAVTQDEVDAGSATNTATATGTPPAGEPVTSLPDETETPLIPSPALVLEKAAGTPTTVAAGGTIDYTFTVTNTGNVTLTGIVISDDRVEDVSCPETTLAPEASTTCTATYTITQADVDAGTVRNVATATGDPPTGAPVTSPEDDTETTLPAEPALTIEKTAGEPSGDRAGDTIDYTFTVTNTGNVTLTGVAVQDSKVGAVACPQTTLAPGASTTCTATHVITQDEVDAGEVLNHATASGLPPGEETPVSSPEDSTETLLEAGPAIALEKSAGEPSVHEAGDTIDYTFTVTNIGNVTLHDITVDDPKVGSVSCPDTRLEPGASTECTATYTVTQADVDAGVVANTATAEGTPPGAGVPPVTSPEDGTETPIAHEPGLSIAKKAGEPTGHEAGDTIDYTFTVTNTGNVTLTGIVVNDPKVGAATCEDTTLAPGASTTCTATYTVTQSDVDAGVVANTATASGLPPGTDTPIDSPEDSTETELRQSPGIRIDKRAGPVSGHTAGATIDYTFTVTNTGNVTLSGIVVEDSKVGEVACEETTLAPGESTECTATYTLTQLDVDSGSVENTATATGQPPSGPPLTSEPDDTATEVIPSARLRIEKAAGAPTGHRAGETIDYTFTVTNTGNVTLTDVAVDDPKAGPVTCQETSLGPGQSTTCTATYTITQADVDAGTVDNSAFATGNPPTGDPVSSDPDTTRTPITQSPALTIDKEAGPLSGDSAGATIVYTFVVTNTGNVTLTDIAVHDEKAGGALCEATELAPGRTTTCTVTYTLTQDDVDAGSVTNSATASGLPPDTQTPVTSPPDDTTTPIEPGPGVSILKEAGVPTGARAGDTIDYTFTVTNTGNVTLTDVAVHDPKVGEVSCEGTTLRPGASTTCTATYTITQDDVDAGTVANSATATGQPPSGDPVTSDPSTTQTPLEPDPALELEKSAADPTGHDAGDTIDFTFRVTNRGNVTLSAVVVDDPKVGAVSCPDTPLAPGDTMTCTATYTLTQGDVDAGRVVNQATASAHPPSGDPVTSEPDGTETLLEAGPALEIVKRVSGEPSVNEAGDTIDYTFTVTNTGNVTLTGITVDDPKLGEVSCSDTRLGPGDSTTCTATYTVTQADVDAGVVRNSATATGDPPGDTPSVTSPPDGTETPIDPAPGLSIAKSAGTPSGNRAGDTITYAFRVTNTGNVTLTGITVDDPKVGQVVCSATELAPSRSTTCSATYTITQADVDAGTVDNVATATGQPPVGEAVTSDPDDTSTPITSSPALSIEKSAGEPSGHVAGATVTFTFLVTNTGNVTLTGVAVDDSKVGAVSCPETTLVPGASTTCTATYTITQADVDAGTVDNRATATGDPPTGEPVTSPPGTSHTDLEPSPSIDLVKTAGTPSAPGAGATIAFTFTVTNTGNVSLTGIAVDDPRAGVVSCPDTTLAPGASTTCTATYTVTQADVDAGVVTNTATATGRPPSGEPVSSPEDSTRTPLTQSASLRLDKEAGVPSGDAAGSTIDYTFTVTNTGNVTLTGIVVDDPVVGAATCATTTLAPGVSTTCTATYTVTQDDVDAGSVANRATASGNPPGDTPPVTSPPDETVTPIEPGPGLSIEKRAGTPTGQAAGDTITFTFTVTNTGNVTLHDVVVHDALVGAVDCQDTDLSPGESTTCTADYTITQADVDAGSVDNTATATGEPPTGEPVTSPPATSHTDLEPSPSIEIKKAAGDPSGMTAGSTIDYTFTVINTGNVTLTGIAVSDAKVGAVTCEQTTLAPLESTTCRATYTLTQADVDAGTVDNSATATGRPPSGDPTTSDPDTTRTPIEADPALEIDKRAGVLSGTTAGSTIDYTFVVTNTGNVTLTGIVVNDAKVGAASCATTTLAPGVSTTCTATYAITQDDIDAGSVANTATSTGSPPTGEPVTSPEDGTETVIDQSPGLSIAKSAGEPSGQAAGATIPYTFTVTNTGNVTLTSIGVDDPTVGEVTCEVTTLAPGASTTCSATYTITQDDVDAGVVANVATANGDPPTGEPVTSGPGDTTTPLEHRPALTLDKSAGDPSGTTAGSTIDYTFTVTNTGNVTLTGITVTDPKVGEVACEATTLAPGASMTCTGSYTITQADVDSGSVANVATATGLPPGSDTPVPSGPDETETPLQPVPQLALDKRASEPTGNAAGSTITYTFEVTNTGNVTLTDLVVNDSLVADVSCPVTTLPPNASTTCTGTYALTQADVNAGSVENTASATGSPPTGAPTTSPEDDTVTPIQSAPALTIAKSAVAPVGAAAGEAIDYTFTVTNTGNVTVTAVTVDDPLVAPVTCAQTTLGPDMSTTCTGSYTLTQADVDAGHVTNTATATGIPPTGPPTTSPEDSVTTPIDPAPALSIDKRAGVPSANHAGATILYTFVVTNTGNVTLTGIVVNDPSVNAVTCDVTTLEPGSSATCTAIYTIAQGDVDAQGFANAATATGTPPTGEPVTSEPDDTETPLPWNPLLDLEKTAGQPSGHSAGDTIDYEFVVTNTGNVAVHDIVVDDPRIGAVSCPRTQLDANPPNNSMTCTATYIITQADVDAGTVRNVATAGGLDRGDNPVTSPEDDTATPLLPAPQLEIDKQAAAPSGQQAGDTIAYTFTVTNTGNVTLTRISVNDPRVGAVSCPDTRLAPGESTTCVASYTITQADVDAGVVVNTANASGLPPETDTPITSPNDTEQTPLQRLPGITIDKRAVASPDLTVGSTIDYTFVVTNTGNVTLRGVAVRDDRVGTVTCPATSLAPGGTMTCSATYRITAADVASGSVSNSATAVGTPPEGPPSVSPPDTTHTSVVGRPSLQLRKSSDRRSGLVAGDQVVFTFVVTNTGNVTLHGVTVTDPIAGTVTCPSGPLRPGASTTCTAPARPLAAVDVNNGRIINTARATASPCTPEQVAAGRCDLPGVSHSASASLEVGRPAPSLPAPPPPAPSQPGGLPNVGSRVGIGLIATTAAMLLAGLVLILTARRRRRPGDAGGDHEDGS